MDVSDLRLLSGVSSNVVSVIKTFQFPLALLLLIKHTLYIYESLIPRNCMYTMNSYYLTSIYIFLV